MALVDKFITLAKENRHGGLDHTLLFACYLLGLCHQIEDCLLIWKAKTTDFDTFCGLDIQLAIFAGVDETIAYLSTQKSEEAGQALKYIQECNDAGDFYEIASYFHPQNLPWFV